MAKRIKKSCLDCKAFNHSFNWCELGFKTETFDILGVPCGVRPIEICPKPKTYDEYIRLHNNK